MLLRRRTATLVPLLLVIFLLIHLATIAFVCIDGLDNPGWKPDSVLASGSLRTDITLLNNGARRSISGLLSQDLYDYVILYLSDKDISPDSAFYCIILADCRRKIMQTVPHFFHGSKYKEISLII